MSQPLLPFINLDIAEHGRHGNYRGASLYLAVLRRYTNSIWAWVIALVAKSWKMSRQAVDLLLPKLQDDPSD